MVRRGSTLDDKVMKQQETTDRNFQKRLALEANSQNAEDLAIIVSHLQDNPSKIQGCKLAVLGKMLLPNADGSRDATTEFSHSNTWLVKIPKEHLRGLLKAVRANVHEGAFNLMNKFDRSSPYHLL